MAEKTVTRLAYIVEITLPTGMNSESVRRELQTCITFGQPKVWLQYVEEKPSATKPG